MSSLQVIAFVVFNKRGGVIITSESEDLSRLESRVKMTWSDVGKRVKKDKLNEEAFTALDGTKSSPEIKDN